MRVVIVGGGAGGLSTASNIRKYDKEADIKVITRDKHVAYSPCAIPYVMCGEVECFDDIVMHTPEDYRERNIDILTETEVESIDPQRRTVTYRGKDGVTEIPYDVLVLATGGSPFIPPVEGTDLEGVFTIRTLTDGERITEWASKSKSAVVVGAGLIGLEIAYGLLRMGLEVTVTEMLPQIVPRSLDPDMAAIVQGYLEEKGIRVILGKALDRIVGDERVEGVVVGDECLEADLVVLATGVRPETKLARMAGCEIGQWAVKVNDRMQTSVPDIYAVGDCVEVYDAVTGFRTQSPLGSTAVRQARVAAKNIVGIDASFRPVLNAMVSKIGELEFGAVGLTEVMALQNGIKVVSGKKRALTKARYYPGAERIDVKMICDLSGRIIGCQMVAKERVAERVDTMSLAISQGLTCSELSETEFSYAPPVSMVIDPIILAAEDACEKLKRVNGRPRD
jgi:NADH oxidase (H2O2-forming)